MQDLFGEEKEIGSETASDIKEGQPNLLIIKTLNKKQGKIIKRYLWKEDINKKELKIIKNAVLKSGAYEDCQQIAKNLINQSKKYIIRANYPQKEKEFLLNLAEYILERKN